MSIQVTKIWWDGEKLMAEPISESDFYAQPKVEQSEQKRPQNCGTSHCSCIECVMEPAQQDPLAWTDEQLQMLNFLYGAGDFDGVWFDQKHPTEKAAIWWRKHLRRLFTSTPARKPLHIGEETAAFKAWFDAWWVGDGEQGETIPTQSDKHFHTYLDQYTLGFGAWMAAKHAANGIKGDAA